MVYTNLYMFNKSIMKMSGKDILSQTAISLGFPATPASSRHAKRTELWGMAGGMAHEWGGFPWDSSVVEMRFQWV
jgi:hypothetical protein